MEERSNKKLNPFSNNFHYHKKGQMQFSWLFALILGAAILFIAIFFSGRLLEQGTYLTEAEMAASFNALLNPFASVREAGIPLSKPVELPAKTNVSFGCNPAKDSQTISVLLEKGKAPFSTVIKNKYIFSQDFNAKELWIFGKSFKMPWQVDDLIYVVSKKYCFDSNGIPGSIEDELNDLNSSFMRVIALTAANIREEKCDVKVCFGTTGCEFNVLYGADSTGEIRVTGRTLPLSFIDDSTMYAAIFGKDYECNLERLRKRMELQTDIFLAKADSLESDCPEINGVKQELLGMKSLLQRAATDPSVYPAIKTKAEAIDEANPVSCPLY